MTEHRTNRLHAAVMASIAAALAAAAPAHAQSKRYPPPPVDYDEPAENHSDFWERTLHPQRDGYELALQRAEQLLEANLDGQARDHLRAAVRLDATRPEAYWLLSEVHARRADWRRCAGALQALFERHPEFDPGGSRVDDGLDFRLGLCLTRAGKPQPALEHFRRVLDRGRTAAHALYWRLGETYMALGRLDEAIEALTTAVSSPPTFAPPRFALAVAYDRAEQPARADEAMRSALRLDPRLAALRTPDRYGLGAAAEQHYYLALAYAHQERDEEALVHLRHYLHLAGDGLWAARARQHVEALDLEPLTAARVELAGARIDPELVARVVRGHDAAMQRCLASVPGVLLEVRRSTSVAADGSRSSSIAVEPRHVFATEPVALHSALACVNDALAQMQLPAGKAGTRLTYSFPLILRESS